jgi:hypothetical protein
VLPRFYETWECECADSLRAAIATSPEGITTETRRRLSLLLGEDSE